MPDPDTNTTQPITPDPSATAPQPTTPAAPSPQPIQPTTPATPGLSVDDYLKARGIDPEQYGGTERLMDGLFGAASRLQQSEPLIALGQKLAPHADRLAEIDDFLKGEEPEPEPDQPVGLDWTAPEYNPQWESYPLEYDERGNARAPTDQPFLAPVAEKLNARRRWEQERARQLMSDFPSLVTQAIAPKLEEMRKEIATLRADGMRAQQEAEAQAYVEKHKADLYQLDENGNVRVNVSGGPMLSAKGEAMYRYANELDKTFPPETPDRGNVIRRLAEAQVQRDELLGKFKTPGKQPGAPQKNGGERFMDRVASTVREPSRGGAVPDDAAKIGRDRPIEDVFDEVEKELGITLS